MKKWFSHYFIGKVVWTVVISICILSSLIWSVSYSITSFFAPDTRIVAATWAKDHISKNNHILTEAYDLGTLPFSGYFPNLQIFNFYDLDNTIAASGDLKKALSSTNYFFIPSQRLVKNRSTHSSSFPKGHIFYTTTINSPAFTKIYETPCDIFCKITYLGDPIFRFEETTSVFDRPTVIIYRLNENK